MTGNRFDETGLLLRQGGAFLLRRDHGGDILLQLHRIPVDEVGKRVRVIGAYLADGAIEAEGVQSA